MTNSHSKSIEAFKNWLNKWDDRISTQDDFETRQMILQKLESGFASITQLLEESDNKVMKKARGNLIPGTNEANEKEVMAMFENQKKDWYKNLNQLRSDLIYIRCILDNVYEIKNRRTHENFTLRVENARLRRD